VSVRRLSPERGPRGAPVVDLRVVRVLDPRGACVFLGWRWRVGRGDRRAARGDSAPGASARGVTTSFEARRPLRRFRSLRDERLWRNERRRVSSVEASSYLAW